MVLRWIIDVDDGRVLKIKGKRKGFSIGSFRWDLHSVILIIIIKVIGLIIFIYIEDVYPYIIYVMCIPIYNYL